MENVIEPLTTASLTTVSQPRRAARLTGAILIGITSAFLLFDGVCKLSPPAFVIEATSRLGYDVSVIRPLGIILTLSTLLYIVPKTRLLGAVLLTAYLGGATATHVHSHTPYWFPVMFGVILWIAYALRSPGLRALVVPTAENSSRQQVV